jgi:hypothetical protein
MNGILREADREKRESRNTEDFIVKGSQGRLDAATYHSLSSSKLYVRIQTWRMPPFSEIEYDGTDIEAVLADFRNKFV